MTSGVRSRATSAILAATGALMLSACVSGENPAASKTVAYIPNYEGGAAAPVIYGYEDPSKTGSVVPVDLGQTSPTQMFIKLSQSFAPAGKVSFLVTNTDTVTHEFVVLATDQPATRSRSRPSRASRTGSTRTRPGSPTWVRPAT
jgi:hypothetical protein